MIINKINKIILILSILFLTQCYQDPFFELTVQIVDENLNSVPNVSVKIEVTDIEGGDPINGSIIYFESITNGSGASEFSFENKAFVTARACYNSGNMIMCKEGHVYLEENLNKTLTLMIGDGDCSYCSF